MILNDYWNGLIELKNDSNKLFLHLPRYIGEKSENRAKTINSIDFKDGDILLYYIKYAKNDERFNSLTDDEFSKLPFDSTYKLKYTNEDGIYAFIYLNGKLIGNNYTGAINERNEFTYNYYIDNSQSDSEKTEALKTYLYSSANMDNENMLSFADYQGLFDKDYYVILRPEKIIKQEIVNNKDILYAVVLFVVLIKNKFKKTIMLEKNLI